MGLFYAMEGVGSFLGIALLAILAPFWLNNMTDYANINENHLDFYLYFLGIIQLITLVVYSVTVYVSRFSLELVPLHSDQGIGGPLDRSSRRSMGGSSSGQYRGLDNQDNTYEGRLRRSRRPVASAAAADDEELIDVNRPRGKDLLPNDDESDDSVGVNDTPGTSAVQAAGGNTVTFA